MAMPTPARASAAASNRIREMLRDGAPLSRATSLTATVRGVSAMPNLPTKSPQVSVAPLVAAARSARIAWPDQFVTSKACMLPGFPRARSGPTYL
jgi:hypothetical protein